MLSAIGIVDTTKSTRTSAIKPINGKNNSSKRSRDSPGKTKSGSKQPKLQHYWLNKLPESANRFSSLDSDNELSNEDQCQEEKVLKSQNDPKPPPIYVFKVEFIQPLKYLLEKIAADNYELKTLRGNEVKIQAKNVEIFRLITKSLEEKNTEFHTFRPKQERSYNVVLKGIHSSTPLEDIKVEIENLAMKY